MGWWEKVDRWTGMRAWRLAEAVGCLLFLAAVWFTGLQFFFLRAICPWCLAEHALGLVTAGLIWYGARSSVPIRVGGKSEPVATAASDGSRGAGRWLMWTGALALFSLFVLAQVYGPFTPPTAGRLAGFRGTIQGRGAERQISLLQGELRLSLSEVPILGRADAKHWVVMLFDYCCPHCQTTHGYLREAIAERPADLAVVLLPSPLSSKCNPHWENDEPRFAESCDLARLAIAVWLLDPEKFEAFDTWLFASEEPRTYEEALGFARTLVPAAALEEGLQHSEVDRQIRQNVDAYRNSQAGRIPVIMSPDFDAVVGRPGSRSELLGILSEELGLEFQ
jgi:hypothetical protein